MSSVMHPSFSFEQQRLHDLKQKQDWAQRLSEESMANFLAKIPQWRQLTAIENAKANRGEETSYPAPPMLPVVYTIDPIKHQMVFGRRWAEAPGTNKEIQYDWEYLKTTPAQIPPGILDRFPVNDPMKNVPGAKKPVVNDDDPVGGPLPGRANKGRYRFIGDPSSWEDGDTYKEGGKTFTLVRLRSSAFNQAEKRFVWATSQADFEPEELHGYNT